MKKNKDRLIFTKPLSSNDKGIHRDCLMCRNYELCRRQGFMCHDVHIKFHKDLFSHSGVVRKDAQTHRQHANNVRKVN
jgi:hypothetical protein